MLLCAEPHSIHGRQDPAHPGVRVMLPGSLVSMSSDVCICNWSTCISDLGAGNGALYLSSHGGDTSRVCIYLIPSDDNKLWIVDASQEPSHKYIFRIDIFI